MDQVCAWKIHHILRALLASIESSNPVSLASSARALLEHVASVAVLVDTIEKLMAGLENQGSPYKIDELLKSTDNTLQTSYYGSGRVAAAPGERRARHVNDCIKALKKTASNIDLVYEDLCEYVHPNFGSNQLVSRGELGVGELAPEPVQLGRTLDRFCDYVGLLLEELEQFDYRISFACLQLSDLSLRCIQPGTTTRNVFSKRPAKPTGDGRGKETAYSFPNARTAMEAVGMTYEFLRSEGVEVGVQSIGATERGWIYDTFSTSRGTLWFKVPSPDPALLPEPDESDF
ncbi:MAG TPA: hypothetical protein VK821_00950 [Dehalococcoidia bacterium]|nr:hypothetical protein [Dehalococcoidia bacterium]